MNPPPLHSRRQLNSFSFPSETDAQFMLLVIAALMVALNYSLLAYYAVFPDAETPFSQPPQAEVAVGDPDFFQKQQAAARATGLNVARSVVVPALFSIAVFGLAAVLYKRHPASLIRHRSLARFKADKDPQFAAEVARLSQRAGISPAPAIYSKPDLQAREGQAFGLPGNFCLRLDSGLRILFRKAPNTFRALTLHELAHIANGDVRRTYLTQAIWFSMLVLLFAPIFALTAWQLVRGQIENFDAARLLTRNFPALALQWLKIGVVLAVVALIRANLLRIREVYADWRAALWAGGGELHSLLERQTAAPVNRITSWFSLHPTPALRLLALENPSRLFIASVGTAFTVGVLIALIIEGAIHLSLAFLLGGGSLTSGAAAESAGEGSTGAAYALLMMWVGLAAITLVGTMFFIAWLFSVTIGLHTQRQTLGKVAAPEIDSLAPGLWKLALSAAVGMEIGFAVGLGLLGINSFANVVPALLCTVLTSGWLFLILLFVRRFARTFALCSSKGGPPIGRRRWLTFLSAAMLTPAMGAVATGRFLLLRNPEGQVAQMLMPALIACLVLAACFFAGAWAFQWCLTKLTSPACGRCGRHALREAICTNCGASGLEWMFAKTDSQPMRPMSPPPLPVA